jgi:flavin reductase (DIM6/NTAB) family NADH-FMN oxidoreductase RutF
MHKGKISKEKSGGIMKKSLGAKTIIYPAPVLVVGSYDGSGKPNLMTVAWGGICCSSPPCVAISLRKATYTYGNIIEQKAFTVNIPSEQYIEVADYCGLASGRKVDKFAVTGLTPIRSALVNAPYVKEFPVILECEVIHSHEIGLHTQFIGKIVDLKAEEEVLNVDESLSVQKVKPILYTPGYGYYFGIGNELGKAHSIGNKISKN